MNQLDWRTNVDYSSNINRISIFYCIALFCTPCHGAEKACSDLESVMAADTLAKSYFQQPELFESSRVLKKHSPSLRKEIVSYVKADNRLYSIFTLVDKQCEARFIKRTRQVD